MDREGGSCLAANLVAFLGKQEAHDRVDVRVDLTVVENVYA
jgi:hypothetical protein